MSIPEAQEGGKEVRGRTRAYLLGIVILLLSCTAAFGLGYLTGKEAGKGSGGERLWIEELSKEASLQPAAAASAPVAAPATTGTYVGSKGGTKYHLPTCSGAKRIKEENKVWFSTKEEAMAAGYTPAANCPGL